jgi:hypothetical protein
MGIFCFSLGIRNSTINSEDGLSRKSALTVGIGMLLATISYISIYRMDVQNSFLLSNGMTDRAKIMTPNSFFIAKGKKRSNKTGTIADLISYNITMNQFKCNMDRYNECTISQQESEFDDSKEDGTPTKIVHEVEERIVRTTTMPVTAPHFHEAHDCMLYISTTNEGLNLHDGSHQGSDENVAYISTETAPSASSESASETTDLEGEVVPETTAATQDTILGRKETKEVYQFKVIVLFILLISAVVVATCVNIYVKKKEQSQFAEKFRVDASKILDTVGNSIDRTLISMDNLAVDLVSYARATNSTWPCVTLPNFALRMSKALPQTDAIVIYFLPIVKPSQRKKWEHYVSQNYFWLNETMAIQETWNGYYGPIGYDWVKKDIIWGDSGDIEANASYVSKYCLAIVAIVS